MISLFVHVHVVCVSVFHFIILGSLLTKPVYHRTVAGVPLVVRVPQFETPWYNVSTRVVSSFMIVGIVCERSHEELSLACHDEEHPHPGVWRLETCCESQVQSMGDGVASVCLIEKTKIMY
jgi:hypothetical protein